jgi:hypothetical protein
MSPRRWDGALMGDLDEVERRLIAESLPCSGSTQ